MWHKLGVRIPSHFRVPSTCWIDGRVWYKTGVRIEVDEALVVGAQRRQHLPRVHLFNGWTPGCACPKSRPRLFCPSIECIDARGTAWVCVLKWTKYCRRCAASEAPAARPSVQQMDASFSSLITSNFLISDQLLTTHRSPSTCKWDSLWTS